MAKVNLSDWVNINLDTESLKQEEELEGGVKVMISPSPYDVPGAVKAEFDPSKGQIRILFRYIGSEPVKHQSGDTGVVFGMGKNSGRLYEVGVKLNESEIQGIDIQDLTSRISREMDHVPKVFGHHERQQNYRLAKQALQFAKGPLTLAIGAKSVLKV